MKLVEIAAEDNLIVFKFPMHFGRRSNDFKKQIWNPFIDNMAKDMKALKGKWNGNNGFVFKTAEAAEKAQSIMDQYMKTWDIIIKDNPENSINLDASVADEFFKQQKKSGNPKSF